LREYRIEPSCRKANLEDIKNARSLDASDSRADTPPPPKSRWYGRFSITITLVTAIGLLTLISVGVVLGVGVWLTQKNTFALLSDNAHQSVSTATDRIKTHLSPAENQVRFIAERINVGDVDVTDRDRFGDLLSGALAAAPQIETVMFIDKRLQAYFAHYQRPLGKVTKGVLDYSQDPIIQKKMADREPGAHWGEVIWRESTDNTYLNVSYPVVLKGVFVGVVVATVTVEHLSDFVDQATAYDGGRRFILAGKDHVLAHPMMAGGYPGRRADAPLPELTAFSDPVLAAIWRNERRHRTGLALPEGTKGHMLTVNSQPYVFIYREIRGFGSKPLIAGIYFNRSEIGKEVRRMVYALFAGVAALIISLIAAVYIGRKIARPIVTFSTAASRIRDLDISKVANFPGSVFRELNDQSEAFNAMLRALRWFELYVPKKIVEHLVRHGDTREMISDSRNITVMFTDMAGFSTISQDMSAHEVADLVNNHFALIGECIDAEGGMIDKFIGDSVMAIWGAPENRNTAPSAPAAPHWRSPSRYARIIRSGVRMENLPLAFESVFTQGM
jgi:adenylate cyclase